MNKILILGAKGNLGRQLISVFEPDYNVIAWDREEIDITDKALITKKIGDLKPNIVINATGYNAVDKCEEDEAEYELAKKLNGTAVGNIARACLDNNVIFVNYSSDYVFDGEKKEGYKEDDETNPINNYGRSKQLGEKEILKLSGRGLKWYLIRPQKLFGSQGSSTMSKPNFFDVMLKIASEGKEPNVVNEEESPFTYTPDLARTTRELVESDKGYGIYHISNTFPATWYKAARELFKIAGVNVKVHPVSSDKFPRPAKRPKYSTLLNTKLPPLRDWRDALREYLGK